METNKSQYGGQIPVNNKPVKIKIWEKTQVVNQPAVYWLTKQASPIWFAKVFKYAGKYTFTIGIRVKQGPSEPTLPRYTWKKRGFKSPTTAKNKALVSIQRKINE